MSAPSPHILVIGSGAREHALGWKLAQSPLNPTLFFAPGNGGTHRLGTNLSISESEIDRIVEFALSNRVDLVIVGPELPLSLGLVDRLTDVNVPVFGPRRAAALIESSKIFAKRFMQAHDIPTADFRTVSTVGEALRHVKRVKFPSVLKADGLAAGKGVRICMDEENARSTILEWMREGALGESGRQLVIEEWIEGEELSVIALCSGAQYRLFLPTQDHKRAWDGDRGPNTGGMGAYAPAELCGAEAVREICNRFLEPTLHSMERSKIPFHGFLYLGLILSKGSPYLLEYNVRLGDPETQPLMLMLKEDLTTLLLEATRGRLSGDPLSFQPGYGVCVVGAAKGYPGEYPKGIDVTPLSRFEGSDREQIFLAGTQWSGDTLLSTGGRIASFCAWGENLSGAIDRTYDLADQFQIRNLYYRRDIAQKGLKYG